MCEKIYYGIRYKTETIEQIKSEPTQPTTTENCVVLYYAINTMDFCMLLLFFFGSKFLAFKHITHLNERAKMKRTCKGMKRWIRWNTNRYSLCNGAANSIRSNNAKKETVGVNSKFYLSPSFGSVLLRRSFFSSFASLLLVCSMSFLVDGLGCVLFRIRLVPFITFRFYFIFF